MYVRPGHKSGCIVRRGGLAFSPSSSLGLARTKASDRSTRPPNGMYAAQIFLVRVSASSPDRSHRAASFYLTFHISRDYFASFRKKLKMTIR